MTQNPTYTDNQESSPNITQNVLGRFR
jgi:hypothetical protein